MSFLLAIDADGVLLDYNRAFASVWQSVFGVHLTEVLPNAYHAREQFGVDMSDEEVKTRFYRAFDEKAWSSMPALPGAVLATQRLAREGHTLICVTSMPAEFRAARLKNLRALGMPFEEVIATGRDRSLDQNNPKKQAIDALRPDFFVDDLLENFKDLNPGVHHAFIDAGKKNSPNTHWVGSSLHHSTHVSLLNFADFLTAEASVKPASVRKG